MFYSCLLKIGSYKLNFSDESTSNDDNFEKFLAFQYFSKLRKIRLLPKQPNAFLTCLTLPIQISVRNEPFDIGTSE